mgnify:FL=1
MNLISHLDLLRLFERALRRSKLPVSYSSGFHPLPRLQIALALPLGVEAFGEWLDIDFFQQVEAETVRQKLQDSLPKGLNLINARIIPINKVSLSQEIIALAWSFDLTVLSGKNPSKFKWQKAIDSLIESKELIWHDTDKKGRPRQRNCRPELCSLEMQMGEEIKTGLLPFKTIRLQLNALIDPLGRSIKPKQVKEWLEKYIEHPLEISRVQRDEIKLLEC